MKVFDDEWAKAFCAAVNSNKDYAEAGATWEGDFIFVIKPSGGLDAEIKLFVGLFHGKCTGSRTLDAGDDPKAEFIVAGIYDNWVKVLKKEIDPIQGMMAGKLKLTGNMAKIMRAVKAAQELVNSTAMVEGVEFY